MKKIGLLSDTHGFLDKQLKELFAECDEIWHAGDIGNVEVLDELRKWKPVRAVSGNIDGGPIRADLQEILRFQLEGVDVFMIHIGGRPYRYAKGVSDFLIPSPKLFICGHSHILCVQMDKKRNMLYMNPGAAGIQGFHQERTALRFDLDKGQIKNLELLKLGSRSMK